MAEIGYAIKRPNGKFQKTAYILGDMIDVYLKKEDAELMLRTAYKDTGHKLVRVEVKEVEQ